MICKCRYQDFRAVCVTLRFQEVRVSVRYAQIRTQNPPPWLCPRQHLRADARRAVGAVEGRGLNPDLPREGERHAADPAGVAAAAESPLLRRRGDRDADRQVGPLDLRPVPHRQADRGRRGAIQVVGRALGRHRDQHRPVDDCRIGRFDGCGARPDPHPHRRRPQPQPQPQPQPRKEPRAAYGATVNAYAGAAGRSSQAPRRGGDT